MVRWRRVSPLLLGIVVVIAACAPDPQLVRRSANDPPLPPGSIAPILSVSSIPNTSSDDGGTKGAAASAAATSAAAPAPASGPSVRIALFDPKASEVADIKKALDKSSSDKKASPDLTTLKRTVILTIAKGAYRPADRLVSVMIEIRPRNFIFTDLTDYKTEYGGVNIASLNLTQSNSTSANVSPTFAGSLVGTGQFGVTTGNNLAETASVSVRPEILNVNLAGSDLVVFRESDRGSDLAGNTLIHIVAHAKPPNTSEDFPLVATAVNLTAKDGSDLPPQSAPDDKDKASITTEVQPRLRAQDLLADVVFTYVQRHVVSGQDTYAEYKQDVEFENGQCLLRGAVIVPAAEIYTPLFGIFSPSVGVDIWDNLTDDKTKRALLFTDYQMADRMAYWMMRQKAMQIGSRRLSLTGQPDMGDTVHYPKLHPMLINKRPSEPPPSSCMPAISTAG